MKAKKLHMDRRGYQRLQMKKKDTLCCDKGILWVTRVGDYRDYILWPGDEMRMPKRGRILVEAMRDADFHILN
jgi:hypothetical protein